MSRIFISHSGQNDDWAIALQEWLIREGWSGEDDIFLDLDPDRGIAAGERWVKALENAATRCEAVLFVVSEAWLASKWCGDEYQLANKYSKKLFALLIDDIALKRLPGGLAAQWQVVRLIGEPAERFLTVHPRTQHQSPVHLAAAGLKSLKRGLQKAGIGAETFELQPDLRSPFGWREPYRGLEPFEPEDAAVFFGRGADIVRAIDTLRGLADRKCPGLLVILGASGAGKSSFLKAGLWPRLARDDAQWIPLRAIGVGGGGAIEGRDGLLSALDEVLRRFGRPNSRADLRQRLATPAGLIELLRELRRSAARRALITEPPLPLPVICLDQAEDLFAADAVAHSEQLVRLVRTAMEADEALVLATVRSDAYGLMQSAKSLIGIHQVVLSLGPVPPGEMARIIREPGEILRRKAGPATPLFDAAVIERLQTEIEGESDALPLLAFVLQRLMREHATAGTIGIKELDRTGGVTAAIESEAEAALIDAGIIGEYAARRQVLQRLFIPRLARIDRESKTPQRRIARHSELPTDLLGLARALTQRRLLVLKLAAVDQPHGSEGETATLEVAHEALLRRWPTLVDILAEDRDALLLLDGVLHAATDWEKSAAECKGDYLMHRGSRLLEAQALRRRGHDWEVEIAPTSAYLSACQAREDAERKEKESALLRERLALDRGRISLLVELAGIAQLRGNLVRTLRFATLAGNLESSLDQRGIAPSSARAVLAAAVSQSGLRLNLAGHQHEVRSAVFSSDGLRVVTASYDNTARIWDAETGNQLTVLRGHESSLFSAAFSPDDLRVVTASYDKTARIWDAATGNRITVLSGHWDSVCSAAFSPDGSRVITASHDKTARIWDAATGKILAVLSGHESSLNYAGFNPDGDRIVTGSYDKTARIWEADTGRQIAVLHGHDDSVLCAAFNPDGDRIVTASSDKTARIWNVGAAKEIAVLRGHERSVYTAICSPDGSRIITASSDKTARIWDTATGKQLNVLRGHEDSIQSAAFSADGSWIVTASSDKTARIWDAARGQALTVLQGHADSVSSVAFSPDGSHIVSASHDMTARIWDAASGQEITALQGHEDSVSCASFSHDGALIVTASRDKTARIWDAASAIEIAALRGGRFVQSAAFSPDDLRIVTASHDGTAQVWDSTSGTELAVLRGHEGFVQSAAFSPDGARIVTASRDRTTRIWHVATGKEITVLRGHEDSVQSAIFSPDGSKAVTASYDGTARIWDAQSGRELVVLRGHEGFVQSAAISHDGSRIVTASYDNTARVWDAASGREIMVLRGHDGSVHCAAINSDGSRIVTASQDQTVRIWDCRLSTMSAEDLLADTCRRRLRGITKLTRDEMRLAGYPDDSPEIDVCVGMEMSNSQPTSYR